MGENWNWGKELLDKEEGRVKHGGPQERLPQTLEGIGERSKDLSSVVQKPVVKINHTEETLKSGFIWGLRKLSDGVGMLEERTETRPGEMVAQELSLRDSKLTFAQANRQAMGKAQLQDISEVLNMRR